jgi:hypothetical protein
VIPTKPLLRPVGNRKGGNSPGRLGTAQNRSPLSRTLSRLPHPPKRPAVLWGVVTLTLLAARATVANAAYQGSDLWANITTGGPAAGPLMTRHPLGAFDLDYHVDASNWHLVEIGDRTTSGRHNNGSEAQDPPRPVNGRENASDAPVSGYTFRARPIDPPPPPTTGETP